MDAHKTDPFAARFGEQSWRDDGTCSYCGSMTMAKALELLKTPGTHYSGSDWKYGWPHKFYIGRGKFYAEHVRDATPEELAEWNDLGWRLLGIGYEVKDGNVHYRALFRGHQQWGDVR